MLIDVLCSKLEKIMRRRGAKKKKTIKSWAKQGRVKKEVVGWKISLAYFSRRKMKLHGAVFS
jgi:hypothetical protein